MARTKSELKVPTEDTVAKKRARSSSSSKAEKNDTEKTSARGGVKRGLSDKSPDKRYADIWLSDEIVLKRDACCMWLERISENGKGKTVMLRISGYYGKMQFKNLFNSVATRRFRSIDATKPEEYLRKMAKIEKDIQELITNLLGEIEKSGYKI